MTAGGTFLATTALSEFWDTTGEILFLGNWCLRASRRTDWDRLRFRVLPAPWNDRKRFFDAARYVDERCEAFLGRLTDYLNPAHGLSRDRRYWRILLGPWLMQHVHQTYDRYVHLRDAVDLDPDLRTIVMDPAVFITPADSAELDRCADDDRYNLQIISQILTGLGHAFPAHRPKGAMPPAVEPGGLRRRASQLFLAAADAFGRRLLATGYSRVALSDVYGFPRAPLPRASALRAVLLNVDAGLLPSSEARRDARRTGLATLPSSDEFERIFVATLPQEFPALYLEGLETARERVLRHYPRLPAVIVSAVGWHYNEALKILAAEAVTQRGTRLITVQHGGGYGFHRVQPQERHEAAIADQFAIWGWAGDGGRHVNMPAPLLAASARRLRRRRGAAILFVANENFRHVYRLQSWPIGSQHDEWQEWELRFLSSVPTGLRSRVVFRPYTDDFDHGFAIRERVGRDFPEVHVRGGGRFEQAVAKSRVVVIDHCGTTLLQTLAADIPTIAYWDPQRWEARDEAEPYLDSLREAGLLWDSPEGAAAKVADVYDDVATWWKTPMVEAARQRFASRFALTAADWPRQWVRLLEAEAALAPR